MGGLFPPRPITMLHARMHPPYYLLPTKVWDPTGGPRGFSKFTGTPIPISLGPPMGVGGPMSAHHAYVLCAAPVYTISRSGLQ